MQKQKSNKTEKRGDETMFNSKYLSPTADLTFKLVFGEHADLLMSLLNALLPLPEDGQITDLEYLTPEMVPENPAKKNSIVDVRCQDQQGRQFIVEMQMHWDEEFKQRVILNASKVVVRQLERGQKYTLTQPVYSLNLMNDICFDTETEEFYHDYAIVNVAHTDRIIEGLRFVFVELPKFKPQTMLEKKMAVLWLRFLTEINEDTKEVPAELLENEQTSKALSIVERSAMTIGQLYAYEDFMMSFVDEQVLMEGRYKRGLAEGEAKGKAEEKHEIAKNLKQKGVDMEIIIAATGLSADEIAQL